LQRSGEVDVFEVVNQLSPPAEPGRYPDDRKQRSMAYLLFFDRTIEENDPATFKPSSQVL
jgi:hypothetical protein